MPLDTWFVYVVFSLAASIMPGPNAAYAIATGLKYGRRSGVFAALGFATGALILNTLVAFGLGTLILFATEVFFVLKWVGVFYLVYLGINYWRTPVGNEPFEPLGYTDRKKIFARAMMINLTNPKTVFFIALVLPQFLDPSAPPAQQLLILALTSAAIGAAVYTIYGAAADKCSVWFKSRRSALIGNRIIGTVFIGFGAALAFTERR